MITRSSSQSKILDYFNKTDVISLKLIQNILYKALDKRVSLIFFQPFEDLRVNNINRNFVMG